VCNEGAGVKVREKHRTKLLEAPKLGLIACLLKTKTKLGLMEFGVEFLFVLFLVKPSFDKIHLGFIVLLILIKLLIKYVQYGTKARV